MVHCGVPRDLPDAAVGMTGSHAGGGRRQYTHAADDGLESPYEGTKSSNPHTRCSVKEDHGHLAISHRTPR